MKALTVQQPWAWAIIHGGKNIENRSTLWRYRGPLAIHAGMRISDRGQQSDLVRGAWSAQGLPTKLAERLDRYGYVAVPTGAVIGVVDLVDAHPASGCCTPWGEESYVEHDGGRRVDVVHYVIENPRPIHPVPWRGALGLWTIPDDIAELVAQ